MTVAKDLVDQSSQKETISDRMSRMFRIRTGEG